MKYAHSNFRFGITVSRNEFISHEATFYNKKQKFANAISPELCSLQ